MSPTNSANSPLDLWLSILVTAHRDLSSNHAAYGNASNSVSLDKVQAYLCAQRGGDCAELAACMMEAEGLHTLNDWWISATSGKRTISNSEFALLATLHQIRTDILDEK